MADSRRETDSHEPNMVSEALAHVKAEPVNEQAEVYVKTEPLSDAGSDRWLDRPIFDGLRLLLLKEASDVEKTAAYRAVKKRVDNCNNMWRKAGKPGCRCGGPHPVEMCLPGEEFEEYRHLRTMGSDLYKASQAAKRVESAVGGDGQRRGSPVKSEQGGKEVAEARSARSRGKRSFCNICGKWHAGGTNSCIDRLDNRIRDAPRPQEGQSAPGARTEDRYPNHDACKGLVGVLSDVGSDPEAREGLVSFFRYLGSNKRPAEDDEDDMPGPSKRSKRGGDTRRHRK